MGRHEYPRSVKTVMPNHDGSFTFKARLRVEGNGGLRVTVPAAVARGLHHLQASTQVVMVKLGTDAPFVATLRSPNDKQLAFAVPAGMRAGRLAGEEVWVELALGGTRSRK